MNNLYNRPNNAFLSYSHKDRDIAKELYRWLTSDAGYKIWFDEHNFEAGSVVSTDLAKNMSKCRSWIVIASKNSITSSFVRIESEEALKHEIKNKDFRLIILRIDDCDIENEWESISRFNWLEMPGGTLTPQIALEIMNRLDGRIWSEQQTGFHDVYVSHGWREADLPFADAICRELCNPVWMLRLISDARDQAEYKDNRIRDIISNCGGHVLILPRRPATTEEYFFFIKEYDISTKLGVPTLLIAENDTQLPPPLNSSVHYLETKNVNNWRLEPPGWLEKFRKELKKPKESNHVFLAAEYKENNQRVNQLREFIEAVTGLSCYIGQDFQGQELRDKIVSNISSASLVIANIANFDSTSEGVSGINLNTCVEGGIALGASKANKLSSKKSIPVFLTAMSPADMKGRTQKLPFIFRDSQIVWYSNEAILLGKCHRLLWPYRRRIINHEFVKTS